MKVKLFDVVIYEIKPGIAHKFVRRAVSERVAERSCEFWASRVNAAFNVEVVPAGTYRKGDLIRWPK